MEDYDWIQHLLYETGGRRRFTQNTPILPDVWEEYARKGDVRVDVLITPYQSRRDSATPNVVAERIRTSLGKKEFDDTKLAANQTHVAAALTFKELIRVVLPMSSWWIKQVEQFAQSESAPGMKTFMKHLAQLDVAASRRHVSGKLAERGPAHFNISDEFFWLMQVISRLGWRIDQKSPDAKNEIELKLKDGDDLAARRKYFEQALGILSGLIDFDFKKFASGERQVPLVYSVSLNRKAELSLQRSVRTIKADAVKNLFHVNCSSISWAVIDSGIDARHVAFRKIDAGTGQLQELPRRGNWTEQTRVVATYDFTIFRDLIADITSLKLNSKLRRIFEKNPAAQKALKESLQNGKAIDWQLFLPFIRVPHDANYAAPTNSHGTHVAGILGAGYSAATDSQGTLGEDLIGVCPDINLIDLRVFRDGSEGEEFNIMAALQFAHHLNSHNNFQYLHGVNLSLSLRHDVRNYACGRTPICEECERLIGAGIVVVAAAGNEGFNKDLSAGFATGKEFRNVSITDPGNAEEVITVGSTHANEPHNYGISYFSSRGPTGDGRMKPDLVAPGEKITSAVIGDAVEEMDGTSMAAPHVSGAAAMIMARHTEFIGRPRKIKDLLCRTATNLGRLPDYQGHGLVDILRALQDI